jgi:hypothetical protein
MKLYIDGVEIDTVVCLNEDKARNRFSHLTIEEDGEIYCRPFKFATPVSYMVFGATILDCNLRSPSVLKTVVRLNHQNLEICSVPSF